MNFSESVKKVRKQKGISMQQLANELCVNQSTIYRWETGSQNPSGLALKAFNEFCKKNKIEVKEK